MKPKLYTKPILHQKKQATVAPPLPTPSFLSTSLKLSSTSLKRASIPPELTEQPNPTSTLVSLRCQPPPRTNDDIDKNQAPCPQVPSLLGLLDLVGARALNG